MVCDHLLPSCCHNSNHQIGKQLAALLWIQKLHVPDLLIKAIGMHDCKQWLIQHSIAGAIDWHVD